MKWTATATELDRQGTTEGHIVVSAEPEADEPRSRVMANLLLDRSGSMKGAPLAAALEAAHGLVEQAGPDDYLGLLLFDGVAEQRVPVCAMNTAGKRAMTEGLSHVRAGQGTALHQAVQLGAKATQRMLVPGLRPRLLLLTDGEPSVGEESEASFTALGEGLASEGVGVHALGLARHYVAEILTGLTAPSGNGFEHADGPDGLPVAMGAIFALLFGEVATQVSVQISPQGFRALTCRHGFATRIEVNALHITLGTVSRGLPRRVLLSGEVREGWSATVSASATVRGESRTAPITLERVAPDSESGRRIRGLGQELELVAQESAAWLALARRDPARAAAALESAEHALDALSHLAVPELPVRRHLERLADLRRAAEKGEGDLPLLVRRAQSARSATNVSQVVIPFPVRPKS
ncbi:MAG: VWA domain-containing protein [Myxococcaceae bacterium]